MPDARPQFATAFHRWFHRPLGRRFVQALVVLLVMQGLPLPELSRHYRWHSPVSLGWLHSLPESVGAGGETLQGWATRWVGQPAVQAHGNAARIFTIAPSCAQPGDTVTITGNGFGAHNVEIYVGGQETGHGIITGGLRAQLVSAHGNRATFIVPLNAPGGVSIVWAVNPGGHAGSIAFRVRQAEICGNSVDEDCDGIIDDVDVCQQINRAPVARAGSGQTHPVNTLVQLDGTGSSDPDGDLLTFSWTLVSKPANSTATLSQANTATPSFSIDRAGSYTAQLTVSDGSLSSIDTVTISTSNSAPVAQAGPNTNGQVGTTLTLDGSGSSDVDGDTLSYVWSLVSIPHASTASLSDPSAVQPTFVIDKPGNYVAQLLVHDGTVSSAPTTVTISTVNSPPVADPGPDQHGTVNTTMTLSGSQSRDVDGDALTYQWSLTSKPPTSSATLQNPTTVNTSFVLDKAGTYTVQLIVNDGTVDSAPVSVTITTLNSQPVAYAGADQEVELPVTVQLTGSGSQDVDDDPLTYFWAITARPAGSTVTLTDGGTGTPSFMPDLPGLYVAQLIVNDGQVDSEPDTVVITVTEPDTTPPPLANVGNITLSGVTNGQVTLTGSAGSVEGGSQVKVTNTRTNQQVTVTANADGSFTLQIGAQVDDSLQIVVTDSANNSSLPATLQVEPPLPPDPATVAPPLDRTVATTVFDATAFLYTGTNPIQTGWRQVRLSPNGQR